MPRKILIAGILISACILLPMGTTHSQTGQKTPNALRYGNQTDLGIAFGVGKFKTDIVKGVQKSVKNDEFVITFQTVNGIRYKERLFLGVGIGAELWQNGLFFPLFGHLSFDIQPKENTFFAAMNLGNSFGNRYATSFYAKGKGAFMAVIGIGYKQKVAPRLKFIYELYYKYQAINSTYIISTVTDSTQVDSDPMDYKVPNHFIGFRIGISF